MSTTNHSLSRAFWAQWMAVSVVGMSLLSAGTWAALFGSPLHTRLPAGLYLLYLIDLIVLISMVAMQRVLLVRQGYQLKHWLTISMLHLACGLTVTFFVILFPSFSVGWSLSETSADRLQWMTTFAAIGAVGGAIGGTVGGVISAILISIWRKAPR